MNANLHGNLQDADVLRESYSERIMQDDDGVALACKAVVVANFAKLREKELDPTVRGINGGK